MMGMYLKNLKVKDFRNFREDKVEFSNKINVFIGKNAQGKTSLLEAIYMLSLARSHRTFKEKEVIRFQTDYAQISGEVFKNNRRTSLSLTLTKQGKIAKVNHLQKNKLSDYIGTFNVILFAPEDLNLVKGGPQERRLFIDRELSQLDLIYLRESNLYQKLLKQRNAYLKLLSKKEAKDRLYLEVLTEQLARSAARVSLARYDFIHRLEALAQPIHQQLANDNETLTLMYSGSVALQEEMDEEQVTELFLDKFKSYEEQEIANGVTAIGPQRDDIKLKINQKLVAQYGSQGQQRTTVLAIKLAEIEYIKQLLKEYPILLLDDVLSELDYHRQTQLLHFIENKVQTFLTTTSLKEVHVDQIENPRVFRIESGQVKAKE
ncbi:DNA replication and repair protein RecF [Aerococcus christensenii]|uniref:DNA replication and repair protein RecF n=2 Tax=Aerococcus christensenii TaxID=87541 RepID=A0A133XYV2_9LACT|nr:DNA replication and repair protein RecF [Aerococcus christensenii]